MKGHGDRLKRDIRNDDHKRLKTLTIAAPIPLAPPVTITLFPSNLREAIVTVMVPAVVQFASLEERPGL